MPLASFVTALNCTAGAPSTIEGAVGVTVTEATAAGGGGGGAVTVSVVVPLTVPLVAVMVVVPAATLVASPLVLIVATLVLLERQVIGWPVSTLPLASFVTALNGTAGAPSTIEGAVGVTVTDATAAGGGAVTVRVVVPLAVPLVAVMVVVPAATLVAKPLVLMVATLVLLERQVIGWPVSTVPLASFVTALNGTAGAPSTIEGAAGVTVTEATAAGGGAVTVRVVVPLAVPLVAVMVVVPAATLVAKPLVLIVATLALLERQVIGWPVSTVPLASFVTALNGTAGAPSTIEGAVGVTVTEATAAGGGGVTVRVVVPLATFEGVPSTAFAFKVPRKASTANWYAVFAVKPYTVHVNGLPTAVPASGVVHVPRVTLAAVAQASGATA